MRHRERENESVRGRKPEEGGGDAWEGEGERVPGGGIGEGLPVWTGAQLTGAGV